MTGTGYRDLEIWLSRALDCDSAMWLMRQSLFGGWVTAFVAVVAWGAVTLGVAWRCRAVWHWIVIAVIAVVAAVAVAWVVDIPSRVGSTYPPSFVLWAALPLFALGGAIWQSRLVPWWRTTLALAAIPVLMAFGALQINAHYAYLPTIGDLVGAPLPGQVAPLRLGGPTTNLAAWTRSAALVARVSRRGVVAELDIPASTSHFHHRPAWVWLPPAYFSLPRQQLPVLMLLPGTPGTPADWLRGDGALRQANAWAITHHGNAPIMVFPDSNGSFLGDTECVDGPRGRAETYLTIDVPRFIRARFHASADPHRWAVAGLSEGGTCALELVSRHPDHFSTFGDFSGGPAPTLGSQQATLQGLYNGSRADQLAHDPAIWFPIDAKAGIAGFITAGSRDHGSVTSARYLADAAQDSHLPARVDIIRGAGHNFNTWTRSLRHAYPWIVNRLNATPDTPTRTDTHAKSGHDRSTH